MALLDDFEAEYSKPKNNSLINDFESSYKPPKSFKDKVYDVANSLFSNDVSVVKGMDGNQQAANTGFNDIPLSQVLQENAQPNNLQAGSKIVDGLSGIAEVGARKGYAGIGRIEAGALKILADVLNSDTLSNTAKSQQDYARSIENGAVLRGKPIEGFARESIVQDLPQAASNAIGSVITTAPSLVAGAIAPGLTFPAMFATSGAQEYGQGRETGLNPAGAALRAIPQAALEVVGEKVGGTGQLADALHAAVKGNGVAGLGSAMIGSALKELPGEELTTTGQFLVDKAPGIGTNQEAGLNEYGQQVKDTALATLLQSGAMAAGGKALSSIPNTPQTPPLPQALQEASPAPQVDTTSVLDAINKANELTKQRLTISNGTEDTSASDDALAAQKQAEYDAQQTTPTNSLLAEFENEQSRNPAALVADSLPLESNNRSGSVADLPAEPASSGINADSSSPSDTNSLPTDISSTRSNAVSTIKPKKKSGTLLATLKGIGGVKLSEKLDVTGQDKSFAPGGYNQVFTNKSKSSLKGLIEGGELDAFLPPEMRLETNGMNDEAFDSTEAYDYLADKIRNGERVLHYDVEQEIKQNKFYQDAGADAQSDIQAIDELFNEDEINEQLQIAGSYERNSITEARQFIAKSETSDARGGTRNETGSQSGGISQAQTDEVTRSEVNGARDIVTQIVKRRSAANQIGKSKPFDTALQLAKDFMNGESVNPNKFKNAAILFKNDPLLSDHFNKLHELAKPQAKVARIEKSNAIESYKRIISAATSAKELQVIARDIQDDESLTDAQAQALDDIVFEAQDKLSEGDNVSNTEVTTRIEQPKNNPDLLGDNTAAKQAIADAERAKDAKRNSGNDNQDTFNLTGSNSEADQAAAAGAQDLFSQPKKVESNIQDLGEKIGGARKDTAGSAVSTGKKRTDSNPDAPTWAKRYKINEIVASMNEDEKGTWVITDSRDKNRLGMPRQVGKDFATKEDAEAALPALVVGLKHRAYATAELADGTKGYEIWRSVTERKRVKVVDKVFADRIEALTYMADNAKSILETNTTFGEADLPTPDDVNRIGVARRDGDVKSTDFETIFGFRGVEFGNWNNQIERQQVMNAAYDGLIDLAEVLNLPPKALALNGDLALAFGARGQGLSSAKAHYERDKSVINLTKMNGAGSLAHEWFHALDHYFGRQDGKASIEWVIDKDGTRSLKAHSVAGNDMVSSGFSWKSKVRPELKAAYDALMNTMIRKATTYVEDSKQADNFVGRAKEDLAKELDRFREELSQQKDPKWYKRKNAPASAEQLIEFDTIAKQLLDGQNLETAFRVTNPDAPVKRFGMVKGRTTNDSLEKLSSIYKDVRGRAGFDATNNNGWLDQIRKSMSRYSGRLQLLAQAQQGDEKVKQVPTDFVLNAKELDQGRGTDYWTTPHELAARAFQGYVEDKIKDTGGKSPFMNYGRENAAIETPWGFKFPFPRGDERKAINAEFDKFVGEIKTKETDTGIALFNSKEVDDRPAINKQSLDRVITTISARQPSSKTIIVAPTFDSLPSEIVAYAEKTGYDNTKERITAVAYKKNIYLVQENIRNELEAEESIIHEHIHDVLQSQGKDSLVDAMNALYERVGRGEGLLRIANKVGYKFDNYRKQAATLPERQRIALYVEEFLAGVEGTRAYDSLPARITNAIREFWGNVRAWLKDKGYTNLASKLGADLENFTKSDLAYLLKQVRETTPSGNALDNIRFNRIPIDENTTSSNKANSKTKKKDNWLFRRDELGRIQLNATGKAYDIISQVTQNIADKASFGMATPELRKLIRHFKADMAKAMEAAHDVAKVMSPMSGADRALVSDVVERMVKTGVTPPDQILRIASGMQQTMDTQTDELVKLGMLSKDSAERWRGKYLPRFYNREQDPALDTLAKKLLRTALPVRGMGGGSLKGRGLYEEINVNELAQWESLGWEVRDNLWKKNRQGKLELIDTNKIRDTEKVMVWRDFTPAERESMGENRDALFRFVMGYTAMQNDIALGRMFDGIAKNQEWTRSRPSEGYSKIPDSEIAETGGVKKYGNLAGLYVRDDILQHITQFEESGDLLKFYRKALSFWKMGKTVLNPVSHMNNVVSNLTMAHFAGVSYWDSHKYVGALRDFVKGSALLDEAKDVGLMTGDITRAELIADMPDDIKALMNSQDSKINKSAKMTYNILTFGLTKPMSSAYRFEDDFFKYLIYKDARSNGLSPDDAVDYATKYIFNYDDLPKGARALRDAAIPFFAYTYKAIPALAHTAFNYPWRFAAPALTIAGLNALAYGLVAGDDDDDLQEKLAKGKELEAEERKNLPPWMQGKSALGTEKSIRLGADEKTGLPIYMDISRMIPGGDVFDLTNQTDGLPLPAPIMPSNPVLTTIAAMLWNKDTFTGKEVTDINDTGTEKAKKRTEWLLKQLSPAIAPTGYHADRLAEASAQMADTTIETPFKDYTGYGKDGLPVQPKYASLNTIGIKARPIDLELSADIAQGKDGKELSSLKAEARQLARMLDKKAVSQREYDRKMQEILDKADVIQSKY
jgi:hypothetical protein